MNDFDIIQLVKQASTGFLNSGKRPQAATPDNADWSWGKGSDGQWYKMRRSEGGMATMRTTSKDGTYRDTQVNPGNFRFGGRPSASTVDSRGKSFRYDMRDGQELRPWQRNYGDNMLGRGMRDINNFFGDALAGVRYSAISATGRRKVDTRTGKITHDPSQNFLDNHTTERRHWQDSGLNKGSSEKVPEGILKVCDEMLEQIRAENPDYWPYGLSRGLFEYNLNSELNLVLDKKAGVPVGFVGWYEKYEGPKKIGYYSIGVLKDHRGEGIAKQAVQKMITKRSPGVDEVRAAIRPGNRPSEALARTLGIKHEPI